MKLIATADQMKQIDSITINDIGIPSLLLMENAAKSIFDEIKANYNRNAKILIVCGNGNNAGDGLALARILHHNNYNVSCYLNNTHSKSKEFNIQLQIVKNLGIKCIDDVLITFIINDYDLIVDAIFGIGLNTEIKDDYKFLVNSINRSNKNIISIDIPSGINATTGEVMGVAIKSDLTITFGVSKVGLELYPGKDYVGKLIVKDIGFPQNIIEDICKDFSILDEADIILPARNKNMNKGDAGKILIIAGSKTYFGALYFSAKACYRMGAGLVYVYTHDNNKIQVNSILPEAIVETYDNEINTEIIDNLLNKVDSILMGPGLGKENISGKLLNYISKKTDKPLIIDADAINLISETTINLLDRENVIITPHVVEMKRLCKKIDIDGDNNLINIAKEFNNRFKAVLLLKDTVSIIPNSGHIYLNTRGNNSLSKGGSGDILAGIVAYLLANKISPIDAAKTASQILGILSDNIVKYFNEASVMPSDILNNWRIYE